MMEENKLIYLDNAATSFPKPPGVIRDMMTAYETLGASPGRGSYDLSTEVQERVTALRSRLHQLFGGGDPDHVIFCSNATDALNLLLRGTVRSGDHVVSSRLEHNSVLRPLHHWVKQGFIDLSMVPFDCRGMIEPADVAAAIRPATACVMLTHASNVLGTIQPIQAIGKICRELKVPLFIDATQTAGLVPVRMEAWGVSAVAFTGHKSLLGPTGIGGLAIHPDLEIRPSRFGGTGVDSRSLLHNTEYPYRLEAGTLNTLGIFGLAAGLAYIEKEGREAIFARETALAYFLRRELSAIKGIRVYGPDGGIQRVPIVLCNIEGKHSGDVSAILDGDFGIATRSGLHCAPLVHEDLGTDPDGAVRFSLGPLNTKQDARAAIEAMAAIAAVK